LAWLVFGNHYQAFLRPGFRFLLLLAAAILLAFLAATWLTAGRHGHGTRGLTTWARFPLLILPLLYLALARDVSLGSHALKNRSAAIGLFGNIKADRTLAEIGKDNELNLLEILQYFKDYEGKKIVTEGMVYRGEDVPDQHFLIFRFMMVCCAADALPTGALVAHKNPDEFETDSWVRVEGTLGLKTEGPLMWPRIEPEKITPIDDPPFPYLIASFF
jgi:uncharacterized repeat protein (TIGR03943 family)